MKLKQGAKAYSGKAKLSDDERQQKVNQAIDDLRKAVGLTDPDVLLSENMRAKLTAVPQTRVTP